MGFIYDKPWVNNFNYCKGNSTFVSSSFSLFVVIAEVDSWSILHLHLLDYAKNAGNGDLQVWRHTLIHEVCTYQL